MVVQVEAQEAQVEVHQEAPQVDQVVVAQEVPQVDQVVVVQADLVAVLQVVVPEVPQVGVQEVPRVDHLVALQEVPQVVPQVDQVVAHQVVVLTLRFPIPFHSPFLHHHKVVPQVVVQVAQAEAHPVVVQADQVVVAQEAHKVFPSPTPIFPLKERALVFLVRISVEMAS